MGTASPERAQPTTESVSSPVSLDSTGRAVGGGEPSTFHWVGTWATAPQRIEPGNVLSAPGLAHNTLRQVVYPSIAGARLRVRFSNVHGDGPLQMHGVQLALAAHADAIDAATTRSLAFSGLASVTIPAGQTVTSDPIEFVLPAQARVAVTIAFGSVPSVLTGHPGSRTTSYIEVGNALGSIRLPSAARVEHWYYLSGIDVVADRESWALVTLGDSLTDGRGSTTDGNDRWPDQLSRRLRRNPTTTAVAVLNQGIGGNAVLEGGLGPTAVSRFERDVLGQVGVRWVIVLHGVNDIGAARSQEVVQELIGAYGQFVGAARARGLRIYGVPILPFAGSQYDTPEHEAARQRVNAWIRGPGNFDAVIDLDAAVRDPAAPSALLRAYDSGDHLHLNAAGYAHMADAVDLALFTD